MSFIVQRNFLFFSTPHKCGNFLKKMDFSLLFFSYFFFFNIKFLFLSIVLRQYIVQKKTFFPLEFGGCSTERTIENIYVLLGPHICTPIIIFILFCIYCTLYKAFLFLLLLELYYTEFPYCCVSPLQTGAFKKILRSFFSFFVFHFLFSGLLFCIVLFRN